MTRGVRMQESGRFGRQFAPRLLAGRLRGIAARFGQKRIRSLGDRYCNGYSEGTWRRRWRGDHRPRPVSEQQAGSQDSQTDDQNDNPDHCDGDDRHDRQSFAASSGRGPRGGGARMQTDATMRARNVVREDRFRTSRADIHDGDTSPKSGPIRSRQRLQFTDDPLPGERVVV